MLCQTLRVCVQNVGDPINLKWPQVALAGASQPSNRVGRLPSACNPSVGVSARCIFDCVAQGEKGQPLQPQLDSDTSGTGGVTQLRGSRGIHASHNHAT